MGNLAQNVKQVLISHQFTHASQTTTSVEPNWTTLLMSSTLMTSTTSPVIISALWSMNVTFGPTLSTKNNAINASFSRIVMFMKIVPLTVMTSMKTVSHNVKLVQKYGRIRTSMDES